MLDCYQNGADLTIMNTFYQYATKDVDGNKLDDFMVVVYKDNSTSEKKYEIIKKPQYTFYKTKDGISLDHNLLFIENDKVEPVTCEYNKLEKTIAEITGNKDFYNDNIQSGNRQENRKLHTIPEIFRSDIAVEDYYRLLFGQKFTNNIGKLSKAFFDIEVDGRDAVGDFVQLGECPINALSFLVDDKFIIHEFLLRDKRNPQIEEFENMIKTGKFGHNDVMRFITDAIGGEKQLKRYKMDAFKFQFHFFDNEIDLLIAFFGLVHKYSPDFIMGWNSSAFDLEYIIARIINLGYEPADIMCDQSWPVKIVKNFVDQKNLSNFAERGDYTFISGTTVWIDQMIQYASRRKSKIGSFKSFKLDDIGNSVAKVKKLDYHHITNNLIMLPWLNYMVFVLYNIFDTIVQKCIENKAQDIEYIFAKCLVNNTSYKKGHRQTVYLTNRMAKEFDKLGFIIGNNVNKWNEKPDKFKGALVNDPLHINDYAKVKINGTPILVADTLQDYDYKSLYPSIILENNIAPNTQVGRVIIDEKVYDWENPYLYPDYCRGGDFVENLVCDNIIIFCNRWLHLANFKEFLEDFTEYMQKYKMCYSSYGEYQRYNIQTVGDKKVITIVPIHDCRNRRAINPLVFRDKKVIQPLVILEERSRSN